MTGSAGQNIRDKDMDKNISPVFAPDIRHAYDADVISQKTCWLTLDDNVENVNTE